MLGQDADWWGGVNIASIPPDDWYHYDLASGWMSGKTTTHQGALFDLNPYTVSGISGLLIGTYTFYFAVDMDMNGSLDLDQIYYDSVQVTVAPTGTEIYNITEYFPLEEGDTWTYREEDEELTTKIISGTENINGVIAKRMLDEDGDYTLWTNTDGIKWYKEFDADDIQDCGWEQINFNPPIGASGSSVTVGSIFSSTTIMIRTDCTGYSTTESISYESRIEGIEDVTVSAGTFEDCIKIKINLTSDFQNAEITIWLAKGLGQIKSSNISSNGTWTTDLVSANVGGLIYP
jgi:hypothetical protein